MPLEPIVQSCIIPYTLVPATQKLDDITTVINFFVENLTISKDWKEYSLNQCDFSEILHSIIKLEHPTLCGRAMRFIRATTRSFILPLLEIAPLSSIRYIDLERALKFDANLNAIRPNLLLQACKEDRENLAFLFIQKGVDPSANRNYPIQWASAKGHIELVKILLPKVGRKGAKRALSLQNINQEIRELLEEFRLKFS